MVLLEDVDFVDVLLDEVSDEEVIDQVEFSLMIGGSIEQFLAKKKLNEAPSIAKRRNTLSSLQAFVQT